MIEQGVKQAFEVFAARARIGNLSPGPTKECGNCGARRPIGELVITQGEQGSIWKCKEFCK